MSSQHLSDFESVGNTRMTRRAALRTLAGASAAVVAMTATSRAIGAQVSSEKHTSQRYTVSVNLNLRAEPGTSAKILLVMPKGSAVTIKGQTKNGFAFVSYQGTEGWAYADFIVAGESSGPDPVITGEARTTANVNFRSGPGVSSQIIHVVPAGTWVNTTDAVSNGFRQVMYAGRVGWISSQFLSQTGGEPDPDPVLIGTARTVANVNLRSGPSTGHTVLRVVSSGSQVGVSDTVRNGFRYVSHNGLAGWMADSYLAYLTDDQPGGDGETFTTTARVNLRAKPSLQAKVLLVLPEGAIVEARGGKSGQFRQVAYKGTVGWASYDYLN